MPNKKRILHTRHDSKWLRPLKAVTSWTIYRTQTLVLSGLFVLLGIALFPVPASASLLSFLSNVFGTSEPAVVAKETNIQNMALLKATINPSGNSTGGADINIVDNEALLPETGPTGNAGVDVIQSKSDQISIYVVREGDSLSQIAEMFGVSINTIVWANDIKQGGRIAQGQTLVILPVSGVRYTVKKGDTLASIAKAYKGDLAEITDFNNLTSKSVLAVGDVVIIPDGEVKSSSFGTSPLLVAQSGPSIDGYFINPVPGAIKTQGLHGYNSIDLGAPIGTRILAAASGKVIVAKEGGWNGGYGSYLVIKHGNGTQTLYSHASKVIVSIGQTVAQGQVIGYVGSTGKSTGSHLHFEVRGAVNPMNAACALNTICR